MKSRYKSQSVRWQQKDVLLIAGSFLMEERKEMSIDIAAW